MFEYAYYYQRENKYLGECLTVVCRVEDSISQEYALTGNHVVLFIKCEKPLFRVKEDFNLSEILNQELFNETKPVLLRINSECLFGMYGDKHCDCEEQRASALEAIRVNGQGIFIHIPQEAQGRGLFYKAKELSLQVTGFDNEGKFVGEKSLIEASELLLGHADVDIRNYSFLKEIFEDLHLDKVPYLLMTSNEEKVSELRKLGINLINSTKIVSKIEAYNISEYLTKVYQKRYHLSDEELQSMLEIARTRSLPARALQVISFIENDLSQGKEFNCNLTLLRELINTVALSHQNETEKIKNIEAQLTNFHLMKESKEFSTSYIVDISIFSALEQVFGPHYMHYTALEINKFFDIRFGDVFKDTEREFKMRISYNINGMAVNTTTKTIYVKRDEDVYDIFSSKSDQLVDTDLFKDMPFLYQKSEFECITHVIKQNDIILLVKRYPFLKYVLEINGNRDKVEKLALELGQSVTLFKLTDISDILLAAGTNVKFEKNDLKLAKQEEFLISKKYLPNKGSKAISSLINSRFIPYRRLQ